MCRHNHRVAKIEHVNMHRMENGRKHLILHQLVSFNSWKNSGCRYNDTHDTKNIHLPKPKIQALKISNKYTIRYLVYWWYFAAKLTNKSDTTSHFSQTKSWSDEFTNLQIYIFVMNKQPDLLLKAHYLYLNVFCFCFCLATKAVSTLKKLDIINKTLLNWNQRPNPLAPWNESKNIFI